MCGNVSVNFRLHQGRQDITSDEGKKRYSTKVEADDEYSNHLSATIISVVIISLIFERKCPSIYRC